MVRVQWIICSKYRNSKSYLWACVPHVSGGDRYWNILNVKFSFPRSTKRHKASWCGLLNKYWFEANIRKLQPLILLLLCLWLLFLSYYVPNLLINQFTQWFLLHSNTAMCISLYPHFKIRRLKGTSNSGWIHPHSYHIFHFYALHGLFDVIHEL